MTFEVPIDPHGGLNAREHWAQRSKRVKAERKCVAAFAPLPYVWKSLAQEAESFRVTLTRIAPRRLDSDNWVGRAKAVRDEVARMLGINDGSERVLWEYSQERDGKRHAVRVVVEPKP